MSDITLDNEERPAITLQRRDIKGYAPAVEKAEHRAMYLFYQNLGKQRSLKQVAQHFGKSVAFISNLSRAFQWQDRILTFDQEIKDPVVTETRDKVDDSRRKLVGVVHDITDTLHEMMLLSSKIKADGIVDITEADAKKAQILNLALTTFGISIKSPKDMRDLITVLKDISKFNAETQPQAKRKEQSSTYIDKMQLVIKDD